MDVRRRAALKVVQDGCSISEVAREFGLSRPTVRLWVQRAREGGVAALAEVSRRPKVLRSGCSDELVQAVLEVKARHPAWGAKKIVATLWPKDSPVCVRTVDRVLAREGLVRSREVRAPMQRFERAQCNELWQIDFKGLGSPRLGYSPLSVLDDHSRFCLAFEPVATHSVDEVWPVLWSLFGRYGLPEMILTDNEPCFHTSFGNGPSPIEARLWLLGVKTTQCRPAHPQTQGKVERFHRTLQDELGDSLRQPDARRARALYEPYINLYNWERPHESLDMRVPGAVYVPSERARPSRMPVHRIEGHSRSVDQAGKFSYRNQPYRAGHGLAGQRVDIRADGVYYAGVLFGTLERLKV